MLTGGIREFAVSGDQGTDVFWRADDRAQRRYQYECIATVQGDGKEMSVTALTDYAQKHPDRMIAAARRLHDTAYLHRAFALGDPGSFPRAEEIGDAMQLFVYLDFFRSWQIAEQEIARVESLVFSGGSLKGPEMSAVLRLLLDFNQIRRACPMIEAFLPVLLRSSRRGADDKWENAGYSLRMVGDLHFRAGRFQQALVAYEAAVALGDNPHRRGLAIRAAHAAQDRKATMRHLDSYAQSWVLPDALEAIRQAATSSKTGEIH